MKEIKNNNPFSKLYLIGSKFNGTDSLVVLDKNGTQLLYFNTLEQAKSCFKNCYNTLLAPSFKPSIPPTPEELLYHQEFARLIEFCPIILAFNKETYKSELLKWMKQKVLPFHPLNSFFSKDFWLYPMKPGFLKKFEKLDVAKDIETTPFVGPHGKMVVRVNQIVRSDFGQSRF